MKINHNLPELVLYCFYNIIQYNTTSIMLFLYA